MIPAARHIPAAMAALALAACVAPSLETADGVGALNVAAVEVSVAGPIVGRRAGVTADRLARDLDATLTDALARASDPEGRPVTVEVDVIEARLAPPIERVAAGTSRIRARVTVTGADGTIVVPPTEITGNSDTIRLVGVLGVATTPSVENDYRGTVRGFAKTVRDALFGAPGEV